MRPERVDDREIFARACDLVRDFDLAIDVGANRGLWTAMLVERFALVHAFEPAPRMFVRLSMRFEGDPRVVRHCAALLDAPGAGEIAYGELVYPGGGTKDRSAFVRPAAGGTVQVLSIDDLGFARCGLIKLDIEGGELPALRGARELLARAAPVLIVEYKPLNAARFDWGRRNLDGWLAGLGYRLAFEAWPNLVFQA